VFHLSDIPKPITKTSKDTNKPFHNPQSIPEGRTITSEQTEGHGYGTTVVKRNGDAHRGRTIERRSLREAKKEARSKSKEARSRSLGSLKKDLRYSPNDRRSIVSRSSSGDFGHRDVRGRISKLYNAYKRLDEPKLHHNHGLNLFNNKQMPSMNKARKIYNFNSESRMLSKGFRMPKFNNFISRRFNFKL